MSRQPTLGNLGFTNNTTSKNTKKKSSASTEYSVQTIISWLFEISERPANVATSTLKNLQILFKEDFPDSTPLEAWTWRVFTDAQSSANITEWLHVASVETYPALNLGILQIAYNAAHPNANPLEPWAWTELQVITDRYRLNCGSPRYFTKDLTEDQRKAWQDAITYTGRSRTSFPAAGPLGSPLPTPTHDAPRAEAEALELLSQTQPDLPSTAESCFDNQTIPVGT